MEHGPVEVLFVTFPVDVDPADVVGVLLGPATAGVVKVIDLVLFVRKIDGGIEVRDLEDESWASGVPSGLQLDPHTLLNDIDLEVLSGSMPEDEQGMAVVIEHAWAKGAADALAGLQAELALYVRVAPEDVEAAFAAEAG